MLLGLVLLGVVIISLTSKSYKADTSSSSPSSSIFKNKNLFMNTICFKLKQIKWLGIKNTILDIEMHGGFQTIKTEITYIMIRRFITLALRDYVHVKLSKELSTVSQKPIQQYLMY